MQPVFCFIDDSQFELDLFAAHIIPAAPHITFILDTTYQRVLDRLEGRYPCLFLLDLYGKSDDAPPVDLPSRTDLETRAAGFPDLTRVYDGLDEFEGDKTNEFLKRLFQITDAWRSLFHDASRRLGQNTRYGLGNLECVRRDFPGAGAAAYTRKSLITDAVEAFQAGVDGLFLKPNGPTDQDIRQATMDQSSKLIADWSHLVDDRFEEGLRQISLELVRNELGGEIDKLPDKDALSSLARERLGSSRLRLLEEIARWRKRRV